MKEVQFHFVYFLGNPGEMEWTLPKISILRYLWNNLCLDQIRRKMEYRINQWQKHSSHLFLMVSWWQNGTHMLSGWICVSWICGWPKVLVHFDTTRCQWYYQWSLDSWWSTCLFGYNSGRRSFENTKLRVYTPIQYLQVWVSEYTLRMVPKWNHATWIKYL